MAFITASVKLDSPYTKLSMEFTLVERSDSEWISTINESLVPYADLFKKVSNDADGYEYTKALPELFKKLPFEEYFGTISIYWLESNVVFATEVMVVKVSPTHSEIIDRWVKYNSKYKEKEALAYKKELDIKWKESTDRESSVLTRIFFKLNSDKNYSKYCDIHTKIRLDEDGKIDPVTILSNTELFTNIYKALDKESEELLKTKSQDELVTNLVAIVSFRSLREPKEFHHLVYYYYKTPEGYMWLESKDSRYKL